MDGATPIVIGMIDDISPAGDTGYQEVIEAGIAEALERRPLDRPIELSWTWVKGLPRGTVHAVREAFADHVERGVIAMLGPTVTDNCLAVRELADRAEVPMLTWPGGEECRSEFMFQYQAGSLEDEPVLIAEHLARRGLRKVTLVHDMAATGQRAAAYFERAAAANGLRIAARFGVPALATPISDSVFDELLRSEPDAIAHFGMFGIRPLSEGLCARGVELPVVSNIVASMAQNNPDWLEPLEGWVYVDMVSDANPRLAEMKTRLPASHPRGPRMAAGLDIGRLLVEGLANAPLLAPEGFKEGLERVKQLPSCAGKPRTRMGFGRWDHAALKGEYLVLRRYVNGVSVEWEDEVA